MEPFALAVLLVMTLSPGAGAAPILPSHALTPDVNAACAWEVVPSPNVSPERNLLRDVYAIGDDAWAVGEHDVDASAEVTNLRTLTMRWDGTAWATVPSPNVGIGWNVLESVTAVAVDDVWAAGWSAPTTSGGTPQTLTLHGDGRDWVVVDSPIVTGGSELNGIDAEGGQLWAVGDRAGPGDGSTGVASLAIRRTGTSWEILPTPNPGSARNHLYAVDVIAPDDVWAVGRWRDIGETSRTFAIHWDGSAWTQAATPSPGLDAILEDIAGVAADDVWAVGAFHNGTGYEPFTLHWDGTAWTIVENPGGGSAVAVTATDDAWSFGETFTHWDGSAWSAEETPTEGGSVAAASVRGSCDGWAVGRTIDDMGVFRTLTIRLVDPSGSSDGWGVASVYPGADVPVRRGSDAPPIRTDRGVGR